MARAHTLLSIGSGRRAKRFEDQKVEGAHTAGEGEKERQGCQSAIRMAKSKAISKFRLTQDSE